MTDFDGTMTRHDFYRLATQSLLPPDLPDYWREYRSGKLTHFEALQAIFASIRADRATVLATVDQMELDPDLPAALDRLKQAGWDVAVTSAGCDWYIQILLAKAGVRLPVWSNPGRFEEGRGLLMELPKDSPFFSPSLGVDKAAIVRDAQKSGRQVAFAGDGFPDIDAARLVPAQLRFARADLVRALRQEGLEFQPFDRWSEIASILADRFPATPGERPAAQGTRENRS
ncbi:MAG: HAD-IB family phosphatase [Planctomycetaceae bacterium]|nr:HAD-IB family phosphatase [Planctomycetaceae bacterium]